jgi:hypothetical protein
MCLGPETIAIVTAIGSAASGAIGSIASYSQQQQQAAYENAMAQRQYQAQMAAYQQSERSYAEQIRLTREAASNSYAAKQRELQAEFRKASEEAQRLSVKSLQQQGQILASGRVGQSIGLLAADAERMEGRDFAMLGQNLAYATEDYYIGSQNIFNQAQSQLNLAASQRQFEPSAPVPIPGPSGIGLVAGIGGSIFSGLNTYESLKAPKATT